MPWPTFRRDIRSVPFCDSNLDTPTSHLRVIDAWIGLTLLRGPAPFPSFPMCSPLARFCQTTGEVPGRGPRPAGLRVEGGGENLLILLAFAFRPGFDEQDQLGTGDTVSQLHAMRR